MQCAVYKGSRRPETYLFVERTGDFSRLPGALVQMMGRLELVMELDLSTRDSLAQADPSEVMRQLRAAGYYVQMPPAEGHPLDG